MFNDICLNRDGGKMSVLVLLDLSAAFDTVDHNILLKRLENWVGLSGTVLNWFKTYFENRKYFVSIGNFTSEQTRIPKWSVENVKFPKVPSWDLFYLTSTCSHWHRL